MVIKIKRFSKKDPYADLDGEVDHFELDASDDGLDENDKILLENAKGRKPRPNEQEVLKVYHSSDDEAEDYYDDDEEEEEGEEEEDEASGSGLDEDDFEKPHSKQEISEDAASGASSDNEGSEMESDLDVPMENDDLPDSKAWGSKRKSYYNTDYVDKDFLGFDDEEAAFMEEKEANEIQKRIIAEMEETDFSLGLLEMAETKRQNDKVKNDVKIEKEVVETDLTKLSHMELLDILKRDSPGFLGLVSDCKSRIIYLNTKVIPIIEMKENGELPGCEAIRFLKAYKHIVDFYTMNTLVFMLLKCKRENTDRHPVVKRLGQLKIYLREMEKCLAAGLDVQIDELLKGRARGMAIIEKRPSKITENPGKNRKERRKLQMIQKMKNNKEKEAIESNKIKLKVVFNGDYISAKKVRWAEEKEEELLIEENIKNEDEVEELKDENADKRAITYKMMKNKGLTPRRKKEMRNPRVRNRNKYKKAIVRRKGQVREVRMELKKYDGEFSGIKKNLSKSIKLQ